MPSASERPLRRGWTTGACAAAAARAALEALLTGGFPDPVAIRLPGGAAPRFPLALRASGEGWARAGVTKDAGDDPDVTHGALVIAEVKMAPPGGGLIFRAGEGVGTVTRAGLPLAVGEPAINPGPRAMIRAALDDAAEAAGKPAPPDLEVTISIPGGEALATKTLNGRLGIVGGLSILGTTGVVIPYSCASWIHSIHRGIDVARAAGIEHLAASTGRTSEQAVQRLHALPEVALIDMGDFAGAVFKYLRRHPVKRLTIAGGPGKLVKLAQGALDLHSARSRVDGKALAALLRECGAPPPVLAIARGGAGMSEIMTALEPDHRARLVQAIAARAREAALATLAGGIEIEVAVFDRSGNLLARSSIQ